MQLPSPEQELDLPFFKERGISCWIKRDDLIHPFVSGNKWRKLQPIVELAKDQGMNTLVSFGGAWSNHLLALSAAAAMNGMQSRGIVRGEAVSNPLLSLCKQFGMNLEFVSREEFRALRHEQTSLDFRNEEVWIPEGGNCLEGRSGMQTLWQELKQPYEYVIDSIGSGTSIRGLHQSKPEGVDLIGIMAVKDAGLANDLETEGIEIHSAYTRGGFAKMDEELFIACREFSSRTGILLDPIYTGKQWMALKDLAEKGRFREGDRLLFIHSGGLAGWLSNPMG